MSKETMEYLIASGRVDAKSQTYEKDADHALKHRHPCKNPAGCEGEMYYSGTVTLRPGRKDETEVDTYTCFRCNYSSMEG